MTVEQILVLAIVQGLTEFLPVSSSGHLILVPAFTGWQDQGAITDVMVHVGSLFAVIAYFWRDCLRLAGGAWSLVRGRMTPDARQALLILLATIPALAFGAVLELTGWGDAMRSVEVVAWNAIVFGVLLYVADVAGRSTKVMEDMRLAPALAIGFAQALALVPGTSRSGATMTAARFLGFRRDEAARFSFLLGIPAIAAAGLFKTLQVVSEGDAVPPDALWAAFFTFFSAILAIAFLMALVKRTTFLVFVIYRLALGLLLFAMAYEWFPGVLPPLTRV